MSLIETQQLFRFEEVVYRFDFSCVISWLHEFTYSSIYIPLPTADDYIIA